MPSLSSTHRKQLEKAIVAARVAGVRGAIEALHALAVGEPKPHDSMDEDQRALRRRLRARSRQLGDTRSQNGTQTVRRLTQEIAYEHWHRMLFARFLAENHLLIEPESRVAISMDECEELAREEGVDAQALAASYAQKSLPEIFRTDDPVFEISFAPETRVKLDRLLDDLPPEVFTSDDGLGWTYQFWQSEEKDRVNDAGEKITGETLPAVTQLFTEHYMVQFLLHNTIGAWHAGKVLAAKPELAELATSEQELRDAVKLPGYDFEYLRFVREAHPDKQPSEDLNAGTGPWRPAAGTYDGWPKTAAELRVLDPCCGSGHFLVAAFDLLVRLRTSEEDLSTEDAIRTVLADNLFGLELDPRCTQIAAFNLAFAAWKLAGKPLDLPLLSIACSGIGPQSTVDEWLKMAKPELDQLSRDDRGPVERGLVHMHELFSDAPELGSLIDPSKLPAEGFSADFEIIKPLLDNILAAESGDDEAHERAVAARGMAAAAEILAGDYTLVITNVPYLTRNSQSTPLMEWADRNASDARADLATLVISRCLTLTGEAGDVAAVLPQHWTSLKRYKDFRRGILRSRSIQIIARLGPGAFETISGEVVNVLLAVIGRSGATSKQTLSGIDVTNESAPSDKARHLADSNSTITVVRQRALLDTAEARIVLALRSTTACLGDVANAWQGIAVSDSMRFVRCFWEVPLVDDGWVLQQSNASITIPHSGRESVVFWEDGNGSINEVCQAGATFRGMSAWGNPGVSVGQFRTLHSTLYGGQKFDGNAHAIVPFEDSHLPAIWAFCSSDGLRNEIHRLTQAMAIKNNVITKAAFDLDYWQKVAAEKYPNGLPEPQSDDPTQWLFHGRPERAEAHAALQVGVVRLLGYRWPAELDEEMRLAPEARELVKKCDGLLDLADEDGIVCLPAIRGESSAADRLRGLLVRAFGESWTAGTERELLKSAAEANKDKKPADELDTWLREKFFEEHCKLFHHRPFVWHVWDGRKDGFHALVNYHKLAGPDGQGNQTLRTLTYAYLRDWITRQEQGVASGAEGADARLAAAQKLKDELEKILAGEPPYDLFIRWKPLHEQPIGWEPDINDGVRLNSRPFLNAEDVGKKGAGVLRWKPTSIKWAKDRGKEPVSLRPRADFPWFWTWDEETQNFEGTPSFNGARWNDLHYTNDPKQQARVEATEEKESSP